MKKGNEIPGQIEELWELIPTKGSLSETVRFLREKSKNDLEIIDECQTSFVDGYASKFYLVMLNGKYGIVETVLSQWQHDEFTEEVRDFYFENELLDAEKKFLCEYFLEINPYYS